MKKNSLILFISVLSLFLATSCSKSISVDDNAPLRAALVRISANYFNAIIRGDKRSLDTRINPTKYFSDNSFSSKDFYNQVSSLDGRWNKDDHPLVNLDVLDIDKSEGSAELKFRRIDNPDAPVIYLSLSWEGAGWLVSKDNLFGPGGIFSNLPSINSASSSTLNKADAIKHIR